MNYIIATNRMKKIYIIVVLMIIKNLNHESIIKSLIIFENESNSFYVVQNENIESKFTY